MGSATLAEAANALMKLQRRQRARDKDWNFLFLKLAAAARTGLSGVPRRMI